MSDPTLLALLDRVPKPIVDHVKHARAPVHVLYGGADRFDRHLVKKLGGIATRALTSTICDAQDALRLLEDAARSGSPDDVSLAERTLIAVEHKLKTQPIEDFRIDFEDGYGVRGDTEEDAHAARAASELDEMTERPPFIGIRIKPLDRASGTRALRTLDIFFAAAGARALGQHSVVTLPKVSSVEEVEILSDALTHIEARQKLPQQSVGIELMVEHPRAVSQLASLAAAAGARLKSVHLGSYDLTSSIDVVGPFQRSDHPACTHALLAMQFAFAGSTVRVSDGATNILPISKAPDPSVARTEILEAMVTHARNVRRSLSLGVYQGWDLHPAQITARYMALFGFYLKHEAAMAGRLSSWRDALQRASTTNSTFDDAATGRGLVRFFLRGHDFGVFSSERLSALGIMTSRGSGDILETLL